MQGEGGGAGGGWQPKGKRPSQARPGTFQCKINANSDDSFKAMYKTRARLGHGPVGAFDVFVERDVSVASTYSRAQGAAATRQFW